MFQTKEVCSRSEINLRSTRANHSRTTVDHSQTAAKSEGIGCPCARNTLWFSPSHLIPSAPVPTNPLNDQRLSADQATCQAVLQKHIQMAASTQAGRGLVALFKRGWNEIPEILGSSFMALVGFAIAGHATYHIGLDPPYKQYRMKYTVYRPDDPRVKKIRNDLD